MPDPIPPPEAFTVPTPEYTPKKIRRDKSACTVCNQIGHFKAAHERIPGEAEVDYAGRQLRLLRHPFAT